MKTRTITAFLTLILLHSFVYAQKVRVFDGEGLNIKFDYDSDTRKIYDIMFTGKGADGKLVWKKTQLLDIRERSVDEKPGYSYQLQDASGQKFELLFNSSMERIKVYKMDKSGKSSSTWLLYERDLKQANTNKATMTYKGGLDIKFTYDKKENTLSALQSYYGGSSPGYKTLKITENEYGLGGEMYCIGTYGAHEYVIVYDPDDMGTIDVTYLNKNDNKTKEYKLKRQSK